MAMYRKKISDEDFFKKVLPEVAANKVKVMGVADRRVQIELNKMKVKLCRKLEEKKKIQVAKGLVFSLVIIIKIIALTSLS